MTLIICLGRESNLPKLGEIYEHCLLYADDLLILSEITQGLQNSIGRLNMYCKTWRLQFNIKQAAVMIFINRKTDNFKFFYSTENLTMSDKYTYLGILFTRSGNF